MMTNQEIANYCLNLLEDNKEWVARFAGYVDKLNRVSSCYRQNRRKFRVKSPLSVYTSVSKATGGREYDLRYKGQSVGIIYVEGDKVLLTTNPKKMKKSGEYYFSWGKRAVKVDWHSAEATTFRKHFVDSLHGDEKTKSPEHNIESHMLQELSKTLRKQKKLLCHIQPVKLSGCFFQMPTPFSASKHQFAPEYTGSRGGGIDILARVRHSSSDVRLCVCELKDENKASESEKAVSQQAIAYATFIGKLLKTKEANNASWWKLFGFSRDIPDHMDIDVVTVMPPSNTCNKTERHEAVVALPGIDVSLHLHSIYFEADSTGEIQSISGSLKENIESSCK